MSRPAARAHPRSRGENTATTARSPAWPGSSPLTRGKHLPAHGVPPHAGLIPAHAGKTGGGGVSPVERPAHPRSRGENVRLRLLSSTLIGSSPLTRGKRAACEDRDFRRRLIPAHAGKTRRRTLSRRCPRAHPRSRGENFVFDMLMTGNVGSSPLTRGKLPPSMRPGRRVRLIPAHAGKTRGRA